MKQIVEGHLVPDAESARGLLLSQQIVTCDFDFSRRANRCRRDEFSFG